jgi:hypothetical protein
MSELGNLIEALAKKLEFDRHLRIGVTADGDYFVQFIELLPPDEPGLEPCLERVLASSDGMLSTCLQNVLNSIEEEYTSP